MVVTSRSKRCTCHEGLPQNPLPRAAPNVSAALSPRASFRIETSRCGCITTKAAAILVGINVLIVESRKVMRAMTPVRYRPTVGSCESMFRHYPVQPIYVPQCNVCLWKRTGDATLVKGVENGNPQIRACATGVVKVD